MATLPGQWLRLHGHNLQVETTNCGAKFTRGT